MQFKRSLSDRAAVASSSGELTSTHFSAPSVKDPANSKQTMEYLESLFIELKLRHSSSEPLIQQLQQQLQQQ